MTCCRTSFFFDFGGTLPCWIASLISLIRSALRDVSVCVASGENMKEAGAVVKVLCISMKMSDNCFRHTLERIAQRRTSIKTSEKSSYKVCTSPVALSSSDLRSLFITSNNSGDTTKASLSATVLTRAAEVHFSMMVFGKSLSSRRSWSGFSEASFNSWDFPRTNENHKQVARHYLWARSDGAFYQR